MASASVTKKVSEITLKLTENEARTLRSIFRRISGSTDNSLRKLADNMANALAAVDVEPFDNRSIMESTSGINFLGGSLPKE